MSRQTPARQAPARGPPSRAGPSGLHQGAGGWEEGGLGVCSPSLWPGPPRVPSRLVEQVSAVANLLSLWSPQRAPPCQLASLPRGLLPTPFWSSGGKPTELGSRQGSQAPVLMLPPLILEQRPASHRGDASGRRTEKVCAEVTVSPNPVLHPGPHLHSHTLPSLIPQPPKGKDRKGTQTCFSLLLKYIFWAVPTYLIQHCLFGTESWRIKNQLKKISLDFSECIVHEN